VEDQAQQQRSSPLGTSTHISGVQLGKEGPFLTHVRALSTEDSNKLVLHADVSWLPHDFDLDLLVELNISRLTIPLMVKIRDLRIDGRLKLELQFISDAVEIHTSTLSFSEEPVVDFAVEVFGVDVGFLVQHIKQACSETLSRVLAELASTKHEARKLEESEAEATNRAWVDYIRTTETGSNFVHPGSVGVLLVKSLAVQLPDDAASHILLRASLSSSTWIRQLTKTESSQLYVLQDFFKFYVHNYSSEFVQVDVFTNVDRAYDLVGSVPDYSAWLPIREVSDVEWSTASMTLQGAVSREHEGGLGGRLDVCMMFESLDSLDNLLIAEGCETTENNPPVVLSPDATVGNEAVRPGVLEVTINSGRNWPSSKAFWPGSEIRCTLERGDKKSETHLIPPSQEPVWQEMLEIDCPAGNRRPVKLSAEALDPIRGVIEMASTTFFVRENEDCAPTELWLRMVPVEHRSVDGSLWLQIWICFRSNLVSVSSLRSPDKQKFIEFVH